MARRRNDEVDSMIAGMTDQMMDDADRASSLERERDATPTRYRGPAARSRAPRSVRTPAPRTVRTPAPRAMRTPAPRTVRTPGRPTGTPIPPRRATGRKTASSLAFTPRFYQMTVVNPGASKREHQAVMHWSEANGEKLEPGPVASTEQLQVFSPLDNADFRLNRFKFVLPRGFFNTEKSDEMYLLLEVFRVDGRAQPQKAGECKCPIFPRPPPYDLYARPLEPIYVQSGLLTIVSTTIRKSQPGNFRHVGRTRYRCRLRELNDPIEAVKSRPTEEPAPIRNQPRSRLDDSYRDWEPANDWPERRSVPPEQRPSVRPADTTYQRPESPAREEPLPRPKTPVQNDDEPVDPDYPNGFRARTPTRTQPRNGSPPLTTARTPVSRRDPNRTQGAGNGKRIPVAQDYGYESAVPELPFGRATEAEGAGNQGQSGPVGEEWPRLATPSLSLVQLQPKTGAFPVAGASWFMPPAEYR